MIDLHCDTVSKLASVFHRGDLMHNPYSVDVERLEKAGALIQCFSTFFEEYKASAGVCRWSAPTNNP